MIKVFAMSDSGMISGESPAKAPIFVLAFAGWNDAGGASTRAVQSLIEKTIAKEIMFIDSEDYYDFSRERRLCSASVYGVDALYEIWSASPSTRKIGRGEAGPHATKFSPFNKILSSLTVMNITVDGVAKSHSICHSYHNSPAAVLYHSFHSPPWVKFFASDPK